MNITTELLSAQNDEHVRRYWQLIQDAQGDKAIKLGLPEIFDTDKTLAKVKEKLAQRDRSMIVFDGRDIGRIELTNHLNTNPSVTSKNLRNVTLGMNACYFVLGDRLRQDGLSDHELDEIHKTAAMVTIELAFERQTDSQACPWLPVAPEGDPSRGWLMLQHETGLPYAVTIDEPITGWFPEFDIEDQAFSLAIAQSNTRNVC